MLDSLRRAGREWRVTFESTSLDAILTATQSGLGIAALPAATIRRSNLVRVQNADLPPVQKIDFGLFRATTLPRGAQTLLELLETALASKFQSDAGNSLNETPDFRSQQGTELGFRCMEFPQV
jgi:DNA-binding transcriptional LysR family regulator